MKPLTKDEIEERLGKHGAPWVEIDGDAFRVMFLTWDGHALSYQADLRTSDAAHWNLLMSAFAGNNQAIGHVRGREELQAELRKALGVKP